MSKYGLHHTNKAPFYHRHSTALVLHILLLMVNVWLSMKTFFWSQEHYSPNLVPTPLQSIIQYKKAILPANDFNTYHKEFGPSSLELESAFEDILQYSNIRLSRAELGEDYQDNLGLVEFSDGSGIYGAVAAFHSLHCLKRLHYFLYPEHYHANRTAQEVKELTLHAEHCLSYLLHSTKCNADLTVFPMQWGNESRIPLGIDQGHHQCKDWNQIQNWMKERSVDIYQPGLTNHPTLGSEITGVVSGGLINDAMDREHHH
ncbi:hypothetical protein BDV26DRAFT_282492 [Aspergillus bertholletiae]|uniref:Uncharacterized protein n=1 Tax=Aspergillus bertholletiae TaxID=1226010 RepID=A0A5N7B3W9_9EURO|nr:hypothetical protein BDV26DRAFT_282492 [Aspergillus bertholletiae]